MAVLANNEARDFTNSFTFTAADVTRSGFLSTIGAANQKIIGYIPAGGVVDACAIVVRTAFGGTSNDITIDIGTTGADPDEFINALDLDGLTKVSYNQGDTLVNTAAGYVANNTTSAIPIYMEINGTLTAAGVAAGEWTIAWRLLDPARLA
jgi:hypothetical protein